MPIENLEGKNTSQNFDEELLSPLVLAFCFSFWQNPQKPRKAKSGKVNRESWLGRSLYFPLPGAFWPKSQK